MGLAMSTGCSNPGNLSNFELQMSQILHQPGSTQSRVGSSTSLGSPFCIAGIRVWGAGGVFMLWEWVLATVSPHKGIFRSRELLGWGSAGSRDSLMPLR